jgi:hypothetical protein
VPDRQTRYVMWQCPDCTWYRFRTNTEEWERKVILHPTYGFVNNYEAYQLDIEHHDCLLTREARIRIGVDPDKAFGDYKYDKARDAARGRQYEEFSDDIFAQ